jgi:putative redox protein
MKELVNVSWLKNMAFEVDIEGKTFIIDADPEYGGDGLGPKPKPLMLAALGGCTAMDVVSILKKMKVSFDRLNIRVEGDLTEEHPKHFHRMVVNYEFEGKDLPVEKIKKAISLSEERYCGVSASYRKSMELSWILTINGKKVE